MAYAFPPNTEKRFQWLLSRYPKKEAALIPTLHLVQKEIGWLSPESILYVAQRLGCSPAHVNEVASFYSMFHLTKKGKFVLQVCNNLTCSLRGADELLSKVKNILGVGPGETTPDGTFSVQAVECLASCGTAPVMQVNDWEYHENLDTEKIEKIIAALREQKWVHSSYEERKKQGALA